MEESREKEKEKDNVSSTAATGIAIVAGAVLAIGAAFAGAKLIDKWTKKDYCTICHGNKATTPGCQEMEIAEYETHNPQ